MDLPDRCAAGVSSAVTCSCGTDVGTRGKEKRKEENGPSMLPLMIHQRPIVPPRLRTSDVVLEPCPCSYFLFSFLFSTMPSVCSVYRSFRCNCQPVLPLSPKPQELGVDHRGAWLHRDPAGRS